MTASPPGPWSPAPEASNDPAVGPSAPPFAPGWVSPVHYGPVTGRYGGGGHATAPPRSIASLTDDRSTPGPGDSMPSISTPTPWMTATTTTVTQDRPVYRTAPRFGDYASWGARAGAWLIDATPGLVAAVLLTVGYVGWLRHLSDPSSMGTVPTGVPAVLLIVGGALAVLALGWAVVDRWIIAGRTGQSFGKRRVGLRLVGQDTAAPIGTAHAFVRDLVHLLDAFTVVGFLWPRWDERRQSLADKLMRTVVVVADQAAG